MESEGNIPEACPGVNTEHAGKASACAGCPNQNLCSSGKVAEDLGKQVVLERMSGVKKKILILSGKGGVGKSTATMLISRFIATEFKDQNFGVLDLDICGPSQPRMMGVENEQVHQSGSGWSPVGVEENLCLMSIGFLLSSPDDAVIWRGPKKNGLIKQFLSEVDWGSLDCLFIDTPPGTSDEHLSAVSYLSSSEKDLAAIIVTTPQEVSLLDVRKEISFCRKLKIPILGVVENMSRFYCKKCTNVSEIFPANTGGAEQMCKELELKFLGSLPLDAKIGEVCDNGSEFPFNSVCTEPLKNICEDISRFVNKDFM